MCMIRDPEGVNSVVKYVLFFFNFIFWVIGCCLIGIGIWASYEKDRFNYSGVSDVYDILFDISIGVTFIGVIVFIISFAGCLGALRENIILLTIFYFLLGILFFVLLIGAVLVLVFSRQVQDGITKVLIDEGISRYRDDEDFEALFNFFQEEFKCCGVGPKGYKDWTNNLYFNCSDTNISPERCGVPYSCCRDTSDRMCGYGVQMLSPFEAADRIYIAGCVQTVIDIAKQNLYIVGGVVLGLAVLQIVGFGLAYWLSYDIRIRRKQFKGNLAFASHGPSHHEQKSRDDHIINTESQVPAKRQQLTTTCVPVTFVQERISPELKHDPNENKTKWNTIFSRKSGHQKERSKFFASLQLITHKLSINKDLQDETADPNPVRKPDSNFTRHASLTRNRNSTRIAWGVRAEENVPAVQPSRLKLPPVARVTNLIPRQASLTETPKPSKLDERSGLGTPVQYPKIPTVESKRKAKKGHTEKSLSFLRLPPVARLASLLLGKTVATELQPRERQHVREEPSVRLDHRVQNPTPIVRKPTGPDRPVVDDTYRIEAEVLPAPLPVPFQRGPSSNYQPSGLYPDLEGDIFSVTNTNWDNSGPGGSLSLFADSGEDLESTRLRDPRFLYDVYPELRLTARDLPASHLPLPVPSPSRHQMRDGLIEELEAQDCRPVVIYSPPQSTRPEPYYPFQLPLLPPPESFMEPYGMYADPYDLTFSSLPSSSYLYDPQVYLSWSEPQSWFDPGCVVAPPAMMTPRSAVPPLSPPVYFEDPMYYVV